MLTKQPAPYLATLALIGLCGIVPSLLLAYGSPRDLYSEGLLIVVLVLAGARFAWVLYAPKRHLHEMVLWLFVYLFLGAAPLIQFRSKLPGTTPSITVGLAPLAAWIVIVGCLALMLGSFLGGRREKVEATTTGGTWVAPVNARNTYLWTVIALTLGAYYALRIGPANLFATRSDLKSAQADGLGADPVGTLLVAGTRMGLIVAFVALMNLRAQRKAEGGSVPLLLPIVTFLTLFSLVNPISSARYTFGTAILAALGALGAYATVRRFRIVSVSALFGIVFAFPVLDTFRRSLDNTVAFVSPLDSMTTGDFDAFAQIINTVEYTIHAGYTWGYQLLGTLFFWMPRSLWPGKPLDTGVELAQFKGYRFQNLSAPLWSEFFINFGWIGVVVGMVGVGFLLRRLDQRAEIALQQSSIPGVLTCITPFYLLILLRGSLLQATLNLAVIVAASWFVTRAPRPKEDVTTSHRQDPLTLGTRR